MQTKLWHLKKNSDWTQELAEAAGLLRQGEVVAFPTETVYGLGADGLNATACAKIFAAKGRPSDNPLILHIAAKEEILPLSKNLSAHAKRLMAAFWPGPMTLIVPKSELVPDLVTAGLDTVAVRMPDHPIAKALIQAAGCPIAAPSANKSGRPSPTTAAAVLEDMEGLIAGVIDGGLANIGVESTIIDTTTAVPVILRPGGITREMLEEALGVVEIDPGLVAKNVTPKAPGMKYRHYAPRADMYILTGQEAAVMLERLVTQALELGNKVGVLASDATANHLTPQNRLVTYSWDSKAELGQELYEYLRRFDAEEVDLIIAQAVTEEDLGLAIMNRMRKAAGQNILWAENGKLLPQSGSAPSFYDTI